MEGTKDLKEMIRDILERVDRIYRKMGDKIPNGCVGGVYDDRSGTPGNWTAGFWPGILWQTYRVTGKEDYKIQARKLETLLERDFAYPDCYSHDMGFIWMLSAVTDYKLTGNEEAARRGMRAAYILAGRFNPAGNFIRAWEGEGKEGWAIIDCMMNLPLLYWASEYTKDPRFYHIALKHAETTARYFIREDGSSKHICVFDAGEGGYVRNLGGQGRDEKSAWSRGNAWALYGFALAFKYTARIEFLEVSERAASFCLSNLPEDSVPFADFKAPIQENVHRDSSAAAIMASGLALLGRLKGGETGRAYRAHARRIVEELYRNWLDYRESEALLLHGCAAYHEQGAAADMGIIFGDYYFLEALLQLDGWDGFF